MRRSSCSLRPGTNATKRIWRCLWMALFLIVATHSLPAPAIANDADVQLTWRLLDYIGVDYDGAVSDGKVISEAEYAEMVEFSAQVETKLKELPDKPGKDDLLRRSAVLRAAIDAKAAPQEVATQSRSLASALLAAYPVPLAPTAPPDFARGAAARHRHGTGNHNLDAARRFGQYGCRGLSTEQSYYGRKESCRRIYSGPAFRSNRAGDICCKELYEMPSNDRLRCTAETSG
jgi:hypothetical protein